MRDYQFSYDDGTMFVYELTDYQYDGMVTALTEEKTLYIDRNGGVILKLSQVRSIVRLPVPVIEEAESYEPTYDPAINEFLQLQRMAEDLLETPDDADYQGGKSL